MTNVARVERDVERVLRELRPATVVGSAACGSDLLVLEAAGRLGIRRRVVLPFDHAVFRGTSVADRPGDWGPRFDAVIDDVNTRGDLLELTLDPKQPGTYQRTNLEIFREADAIARPDEDRTALVLWNGTGRGDDDVTDAFRNEARRRNWPTAEIDTAR
jgi:hypothetical protein